MLVFAGIRNVERQDVMVDEWKAFYYSNPLSVRKAV